MANFYFIGMFQVCVFGSYYYIHNDIPYLDTLSIFCTQFDILVFGNSSL